MGQKEVKMIGCTCNRCGHEWVTRKDKPPVTCPKCNSPYWDREYVFPVPPIPKEALKQFRESFKEKKVKEKTKEE